jgi:hypothetical protein
MKVSEISDYAAYVASLSDEARAELASLIGVSIEDAKGVQIVKDDDVCVAPKEEIVEKVAVKKVKCKCCGFAKKHYRVLPSGLCKSCDAAFRDESGEVITDGDVITVVGKQGKRGRNNVSIVHPISGRRWCVQRKVRLDS